MDIFSQCDYYPSPSSAVILYKDQPVTRVRKAVSQADIFALIVYLSSPLDEVSYPAFSDFFLIYRGFIGPQELYALLITRFNWSCKEIESSDKNRSIIGQIATVRTFVLIRHGILNHFAEDFLVDQELRIQFIEFLNHDYSKATKLVKNCIINLKKIWIHSMKINWTNIILDEPKENIGNNQDSKESLWLNYKIMDVSQLDISKKRNSRFSFIALQGMSSPDFRNKSVLSLYKTSDNSQFQLPDNNIKNKTDSRRTPSMLLFPHDNSNTASNSNQKNDYKNITEERRKDHPVGVSNRVEKGKTIIDKISRMSGVPTHLSSTMTDLEYPNNAKVDKIIPPTPAKKIELILNSVYNPSVNNENTDRSVSLQNKKLEQGNDHRNNKNQRNKSINKGPIDLLIKWKSNHIKNKKHLNHQAALNNDLDDAVSNAHTVNPEMDTFVKYVISISSLDKSTVNSNDFLNLDSSHFDILSARTIDEVEYLLSLENELLERMDKVKGVTNVPVTSNTQSKTRDRIAVQKSGNNFSAMDNLDLYKTVSSIAQSVISLTNTLNSNIINNAEGDVATPSYGRRKVQSSTAALFSQANNSSKFILKQNPSHETIVEKGPIEYYDGPQRLVFHTSSGESPNKHRQLGTVESPKTTLNYSPVKMRSSSPLKNTLDDLFETSVEEENSKTLDGRGSSVNFHRGVSISMKEQVVHHESNESIPLLRKKNSFDNLREFTFEGGKTSNSASPSKERPLFSGYGDGEDDDDIFHDASDMTGPVAKETVSDNDEERKEATDEVLPLKTSCHNSVITKTAIRPASGRISIIRRQSTLTRKKSLRTQNSPVKINIRNTDYYQKDRILEASEKQLYELEGNMKERRSVTPSIETSALFTSRQNSPQKRQEETLSQAPISRIRLSIQPSIQSIISDESLSNYSTFDSSDSVEDSLRTKFQKGLANKTKDNSINNLNKYFYEPDTMSINDASPAKDVEGLKNRFMKMEERTPQKNGHVSTVENGRKIQTPKGISRQMNEDALKNIADITDDSIHDDPLKIAMMKLEGTYTRARKKLITESSPDILNVSREVEMLDISNIMSISSGPKDKRNSLLIQRRRQTIMNIPYTPRERNSFGENSEIQRVVTKEFTAIDIQNLLKDYKIQDQNLLSNNIENHVPFILTYDSLSIANQMTLIERELMYEIDWKDLLDLKIKYEGPSVTSWLQLLIQNEALSGVDLAIARFNLTVDWIISEIVITKDVKMKRNTIQRLIHVAEHCRILQNYNTLMQIVLALNSTVVQKFIDAWRLIEPGDLLTWEELKKIPSLDRNYFTIRKLLNHVDPIKGCIPFIVVYLSDLSLNSEKRDWIETNKIINYNKFDTNVQIVKHFIQRVQWSNHYKFEADHELLSKCVYLTSLSQEEIDTLMNEYTGS